MPSSRNRAARAPGSNALRLIVHVHGVPCDGWGPMLLRLSGSEPALPPALPLPSEGREVGKLARPYLRMGGGHVCACLCRYKVVPPGEAAYSTRLCGRGKHRPFA